MTLGPNDIIVLIRPLRQRRPSRSAGGWIPVGVAGDAYLASAMAAVITGDCADCDARTLTAAALLRELPAEESGRILERLRNSTVADSRRADELRTRALAQLEATGGTIRVR